MPLRRIILLSIVATQLVTACDRGPDAVGKFYETFSELDTAQEEIEFIRIGRFGNQFPARIVQIELADDEIKFTRANGQPHAYSGFQGYQFKMIRLESDDHQETVVVYRSRNKR